MNSSRDKSSDGSFTVSQSARSRCIQTWMTRQRFCGSAVVGLRLQALAAASNVATNSVIDRQERQSSTEYRVALYLARASDGGG